MKSPAHDLALHLATLGVGTFAGASSWSINASQEPTEPRDAITLYDTGGGEPDTEQLDLLKPTFQVRVRSLSYPNAYSKHEAIRDLLILDQPIVTENSTFLLIAMTSEIISIGLDENNNHILTANYRSIRERS